MNNYNDCFKHETLLLETALDKLNKYYKDGKHLFKTISVSTLIVARALMCIKEKDFRLKNAGSKYKIYKRFIDVAKKCADSEEEWAALKKLEIKRWSKLHEMVRDYEDKSKHYKIPTFLQSSNILMICTGQKVAFHL